MARGRISAILIPIAERRNRASAAESLVRSRLYSRSMIVPRFFLHLRDGTDETLDPDGLECADLPTLKQAILKNARDVIAGDVQNGVVNLRLRIDAENDEGTVVHSQPFATAVRLLS